MYYEDLTDYSYDPEAPPAKNVGWLSADGEFEPGSVPSGFVDALWLLCRRSVRRTRGFHLCELCERRLSPLVLEHDGQSIKLGTAEMRAFSAEGTVFAAPDLIFHYVRDHSYRPPDSFVEAVLHSAGLHPRELSTLLRGQDD